MQAIFKVDPEMQAVINAYIMLINNDPRLSDLGVQTMIDVLKRHWEL